jgi:hypothetical protein
MAYITPEQVKNTGNDIKKAYPKFKFSIKTKNYSAIVISILEGPLTFGTDYEPVSILNIEKNFIGEGKDMLLKIIEIVYMQGEGREQRDFYVHLNIGTWDKKYKQIPPTT